MLKTITFLIFILSLGCSVPNSEEHKAKSIIGVWVFESTEKTGTYSDEIPMPINDSTLNLVDFFGPENILSTTGKTIEFLENNKIHTNWLEQGKLEKVKFAYDWQIESSLLVFSAVSPKDNKHFTIPTKVNYQDSVMFWNVGDILTIKLKRMNE
ncbi:MAG: hypothetical protein RLZ33_512 [Bacteroidota bacterium]|jgi:hypothetical protein